MPQKFTPEGLLSAPRRTPAIPNNDGSLALYSVSTYSFETHSDHTETRILHIESGHSILFTDDSKVIATYWFRDIQVLSLKHVDGGVTEFWVSNAVGEREAYLLGIVDASVSLLKHVELDDDEESIAIVLAAPAAPDGTLFNAEKATKPLSSVREYESGYVRCYDHYYAPERNALWFAKLGLGENGRYKLQPSQLVNILKNTGLECPFPDSFGAESAFSVSKHGLLFSCLDSDITKKSQNSLFHVAFSSVTEISVDITKVEVEGYDGSAANPVYSRDGESFAFTLGKHIVAGANQQIFIGNSRSLEMEELQISDSNDEKWDHNPAGLIWSNDAKWLYIIAEDNGRTRIFQISTKAARSSPTRPTAITNNTDSSILAALILNHQKPNQRLLATRSSFVDGSIFEIVDVETGSSKQLSSLTKNGVTLGLSSSQVSETHYPGADSYKVQAWVVRPKESLLSTNVNKKYPVLVIVHGGPQASHTAEWTRGQNSALFAEQGYVVVLPNITGSTGFGEDFTTAIVGDWGGRPYQDLVKCMDHLKTLPFIDTERAVALGGSYGGYMMSWIAGQPLAKDFKTLVYYDGIFSMSDIIASDMVAPLPRNYSKKAAWEDRAAFDMHDPSRYTQNWTTPMLVIHSDKDYRCPVSQGWAVYNVCKARGVDARFLNFPDESHGVVKIENQLQWWKTVLGWMNRYVGVKDGIQLEPPKSEPTLSHQRVNGMKTAQKVEPRVRRSKHVIVGKGLE